MYFHASYSRRYGKQVEEIWENGVILTDFEEVTVFYRVKIYYDTFSTVSLGSCKSFNWN